MVNHYYSLAIATRSLADGGWRDRKNSSVPLLEFVHLENLAGFWFRFAAQTSDENEFEMHSLPFNAPEPSAGERMMSRQHLVTPRRGRLQVGVGLIQPVSSTANL